MSLRHIRKVSGRMQVPLPVDESDSDFEPAYTKKFTRSIYSGLEISSDSEENDDVNEVSEETASGEPKPVETRMKKQKKKKQRRYSNDDDLDEIDRSLKEINEMLGEPEECPVVEPKRDLEDIKKKLFTVKQKFMDAERELTLKFGPDEDETMKKRGRRPNLRGIAKKDYIIPCNVVYKKNGLSMSLKEQTDDTRTYIFDHSKHYRIMHNSFLYVNDEELIRDTPYMVLTSGDPRSRMHVEALLEVVDRMYTMEEYAEGNKIIEEIICFMQQSAHAFFSVTDIRTRLPYKSVENRAFHIALFKYMHMLTNKACHRTALEIAKILLNLDPSDPLAVLYVIDIVALRAGEWQWMIEAFEYWVESRDAGYMFNMQYSYALATYHVALKKKKNDPKYAKPPKMSTMEPHNAFLAKLININYKYVDKTKLVKRPEDDKDGFEEADELLQKAMLRFPYVLTCIFQNSGNRNEKMKASPLFNGEMWEQISKNMKDLMFLHTRLIWYKYTEEPVLKWVMRNVEELVDKFTINKDLQFQAMEYANMNMHLFQEFPLEIKRHLSILSPLSNLITDGAVPNVGESVSYDPFPPPDGIDNYEPIACTESGRGFFEFFSSILPDPLLEDPPEENSSRFPVLEVQPPGSSDHHSTSLTSNPNNEETFKTSTMSMDGDDKSMSMDEDDNEEYDEIVASIPIQNPIEFKREVSDCIHSAISEQEPIAIGISEFNYESIVRGSPKPVSRFAVFQSSIDENNDANKQQDGHNRNDDHIVEDKNTSDDPIKIESYYTYKLKPAIAVEDDWLKKIIYDANKANIPYSKIFKCNCASRCFSLLYFMEAIVSKYEMVDAEEHEADNDQPPPDFDFEEYYEYIEEDVIFIIDTDDDEHMEEGESDENGGDGSDDDEDNENEYDAAEQEAQNVDNNEDDNNEQRNEQNN